MDRLGRRGLLIATGTLLAAPRVAVAQQPVKRFRIGYLAFNTELIGGDLLIAFREALRDLGWIDGQNIDIEARFAAGRVERLPGLVRELLDLNVDVIAAGSSATTRASKSATATVPIVMLASANAVGEGFVASLARPGGNVTGMTLSGPEMASKQLELLREIAAGPVHIAFLMNPSNGSHAGFAAELKAAARKIGVQLHPVSAASPHQLEDAFAAMAKERASAVLVLSDAMFLGERRWITDRALSAALPAMYTQREFVDAGGLVSYGPSLVDMARRAARQVDKVLRGARPSDIPVEQPTKFEFVINMKTAKALGLTIPQTLLLRADEVLQ